MKRAGISSHSVCDLRHTFATLLLARAVPITYVAAQFGHAKLTKTLQWYAHWIPSESKSFVDSLDRVVD
jgi:site-specific recombinase XerD